MLRIDETSKTLVAPQAGGLVTEGSPDRDELLTLVEGRFTLLAPDNYRGDTLVCKLFDKRGSKIAQESLYEDDIDDEE